MIAPGVCRHCGCTEDDAHRLPNGDSCCWIDTTLTVCSNPDCMIAEEARKAAAKAAARTQPKYGDKYRGWGYGAIAEDLRKQYPAKRKRKRRAA